MSSQKNTLLNYFSKSPATNRTNNDLNSPKTPTTPQTPKNQSSSKNKPSSRKRLVNTPSTPRSSKKTKVNTTEVAEIDFEELDIVWAKLASYPWWPSIVCRHHSNEKYEHKKEIHVQFFDDPPTHAWIPKNLIEVYGKTKKFPPLNDKDKWEKAVSDADEALKLPQEDRTKLLFDFSQEEVDSEEASLYNRISVSKNLSSPNESSSSSHINFQIQPAGPSFESEDRVNQRMQENQTTEYPNNSSRNSHYNTLEEKMNQIADAITESQRKFQQSMIKINEQDNDEIDLFYKSISLSVKRLPPHLINEAKMQHLHVIANLERTFLNENLNHSFQNHSINFRSSSLLNGHLEDSGFELISD